RHWHSFKGTKTEAKAERNRLVAEMQGGGAVDPSRITVGEYLDRFERDWIAVHVSANSAARYRGALSHVRQHLGTAQLQKVRAADVAQLYASLSRAGLDPRTIRLIHFILHRALTEAKRWGLIRDNVADSVKPPKASTRETEMLQPEQARELLERLRGR